MPIAHHTPRVLAALLAGSLSIAALTTVAQDGTGGSTPEPTFSCQMVAANWVPAVASPVASPLASPVASPVLSPVASPVVETTTDPLTTDLTAATESILDCMSENNVEVLTNITGESFRGTWLGFGGAVSNADFAALLPMLPHLPYSLVSVENATIEGETATATVNYTVGRQLLSGVWTFALIDVDGTPTWAVRNEVLQAGIAPAGAVNLDLTITDGVFTFSAPSVQGSDIVINVTNSGAMPHESLILRVPATVTAADIAAAPTGIPEGVTFIAQATVPAGGRGTIILTDLRPGTYTVVDLLPDANGIPNVSSGMITTFEVTAP